jgi:hypothetical protein
MIAKEQREDNEIAAEEGIELGDIAKPAEPEEDEVSAE